MGEILFRQSNADFPMNVALGDKSPSWGLSRWKGNHGLRFIPPDDEGFALRGDKRRLVYKGRKRSHRFTILGDTAFEYDCILEKEPESNVIALRMEGADQYDFFRQPDFIKDPFLAGSYAVYKKEILLGEGTGKLCHIHRPLIIDARGRKVFGDLTVVGNELRITVPEGWLAEAAYPVIVDPTVGTTTIGSQCEYIDGRDRYPYMIGESVAVNKYTMPENLNGNVTAFVYFSLYDKYCSNFRVFPCLYSDNGNQPYERLSANEALFDYEISPTRPNEWRSSSFSSNRAITGGSDVWFGISCCDFYPRFDYGAKCYICYYGYWEDDDEIPDIYPIENDWFSDNIILSMYFTYTASQSYVRTLTQGVNLTDSRKTPLEFLRTAQQTVQGKDTVTRLEAFIRQCVDTVSNSMVFNRSQGFFRTAIEQIDISGGFSNSRELSRKFNEILNGADHLSNRREIIKTCEDNVSVHSFVLRIQNLVKEIRETLTGIDMLANSREILRNCADDVSVESNSKRYHDLITGIGETTSGIDTVTNSRELFRNFGETVHANSGFYRVQRLIKTIKETLTESDTIQFPVVFVRSVKEKPGVFAVLHSWRVYYRFLFDVAGNAGEADRNGEFIRLHGERVHVQENVLRSLFIAVRLVASSIVRDLLFSRFLNARKEIVLKSCITLDITLDSRIGRT